MKALLRSSNMQPMISLSKAEMFGMHRPGRKLSVPCKRTSLNFTVFLTEILRKKYQTLLSYIALKDDSVSVHDDNDGEDSIFGDENDPNDKTAVDIDLTLCSKTVDSKHIAPTDKKSCQCHYLFCTDCLPSDLSLKGCWYEERTPEEQQQELAHELERRRQQGVNQASPYRPIVRIRHHPDGRKLVFRKKETSIGE